MKNGAPTGVDATGVPVLPREAIEFCSRLWPWALAVPLLGLVGWAVAIALADNAAEFVDEGPIEIAQFVVWLAAGLSAFIRARLVRHRRISAGLLVLGVAALVCAAREMDLQELIRPENMGYWGMHSRLDWFTDLNAPWPPKLLWACIAVAVFSVVVVALRVARPDWPGSIRLRRPLAILLALSAAGMLTGWALDDLLRPFVVRETVMPFEELAEYGGAGCFFAAMWAPLMRPTDERKRLAEAQSRDESREDVQPAARSAQNPQG